MTEPVGVWGDQCPVMRSMERFNAKEMWNDEFIGRASEFLKNQYGII